MCWQRGAGRKRLRYTSTRPSQHNPPRGRDDHERRLPISSRQKAVARRHGSRCHVQGPGGGDTRSVEGLNELGEAPPPYDAKGAALTDVEATRPPPGYCHVQPPPPVHIGAAIGAEERMSEQQPSI